MAARYDECHEKLYRSDAGDDETGNEDYDDEDDLLADLDDVDETEVIIFN